MSRLSRVVLENFLSFGHVDFDLCGKGGTRGYALIYGENGSGKTNLIRSLGFLRSSVSTIVLADAMDEFRAKLDRDGPRQFPDDPERQELETAMFHLTRFDLGKTSPSLTTMGRAHRLTGSEEPMEVRYEFETDVAHLAYAMTFAEDGMLIREELSRFTKGTRTSRIFLVEGSDDGIAITFGRSVFAAELSRTLRRRISVSWGKNSLLAILLSEFSRSNRDFIDGSISGEIRSTIGFIRDLSVDGDGPVFQNIWSNGMQIERGFTGSDGRKYLEAYGKAASAYLVRLYSDIKKAEYETVEKDGRIEYRLMVEKCIAGVRRRIPVERESAGTRKLLGMLPELLRCAAGGVALIDEFDSGVHDKIVHDMLDQILPGLKGQLIITTHNTLLLETADPSNVYVIRTSVDGFKEIRTFDSIATTKKGHNNNRLRYLQGLYDGVPIIRTLDLELIADRLNVDLGEGA